jgi:hypothetical protein
MKLTLTLLTALLLAPLAALHAADNAPSPASWSDDFSDAAASHVRLRPKRPSKAAVLNQDDDMARNSS